MDKLVFLRSNEIHEEPYTTSEVIANCAGVKHHAIQELIRKYKQDFEEFGRLAFEMRAEANQGFVGTLNHSKKIYHFNEEQATLLITFLQNTEQVRTFKKALVKEFYQMKSELTKRQITREITKKDRKNLVDTIKEKEPDKKWRFKHYTDLDYKCVLGMTAKKFEETYNIPDGKLRDYLEAGQLQQIGILEAATKALIDAGYTYEEIKEILSRKFIQSKIA